MQGVHVPRIELPNDRDLAEVSRRIEQQGAWVSLDEVPWNDFPYKPRVRVGLAHAGGSLLITFAVEEQAILAEKVETNGQVSEDSCVELFLSPPSATHYYNFEWNCIGTCMVGVGSQRHGRELLAPSVISQILRESSLGSSPFPERTAPSQWSLTAVVPVGVLVRDDVTELSGLECRGNLFKCGDHLTVPHYLTWSPISTPRPDFHRPEQFGTVVFD